MSMTIFGKSSLPYFHANGMGAKVDALVFPTVRCLPVLFLCCVAVFRGRCCRKNWVAAERLVGDDFVIGSKLVFGSAFITFF